MLNQEVLRPVSNNASPHLGQSPGMPSRVRDDGTQETGVTKPSNEKLALGFKLNDSSPRHGQSSEPQSSSNVRDEDVKENLKSLNDKLAAAFLTINAKEELVRQHAKVTEEAVLGKYILSITSFFLFGEREVGLPHFYYQKWLKRHVVLTANKIKHR